MAAADCCRTTVLSSRMDRATPGASCATLGATTVLSWRKKVTLRETAVARELDGWMRAHGGLDC